MHVKKKLHDRAVKEGIKRPKKFNFVGTYIAPIWRENHIGSSDEDEDDEEARRAKEERKQKRQAHKDKKVADLIEQREHERKFRTEADASKSAKKEYEAPKELRVGKPRETHVF